MAVLAVAGRRKNNVESHYDTGNGIFCGKKLDYSGAVPGVVHHSLIGPGPVRFDLDQK